MGRPELHSATSILDGARSIVLDGGAPAATINAIALASSAPAGSIYHRFGSRDAVLAELWIRAVERAQAHFTAALKEAGDPLEAAVAAGLSVFDFSKENRDDARLLASLRREDLIRSQLPQALTERLQGLNRRLEPAVARLAREVYGADTAAARELIALAVIDIPYGAVRRYLIGGGALPAGLRPHIERAIRAVLDRPPIERRSRRT